jgi:hypothetical protein
MLYDSGQVDGTVLGPILDDNRMQLARCRIT